ncbi:MAG: hypothetical protein RL536_55 [Candidatus Parcubacteria bacterium]
MQPNIKNIAKQAFLYSIAVLGVAGLIALVDFSNTWIHFLYPNFPSWTTAFIFALPTVTIGVAVWRRLRESDILKYEFITTVTHKFRTPLTHIKWASENLAQEQLSENGVTQIGYIQDANAKLVELTDLLVNASETENALYKYRTERVDIGSLIDEVLKRTNDHVVARCMKIERNVPAGLEVMCDTARMRFVIHTLVENAINYSKDNCSIIVNVEKKDNMIIISVKDSGIGIAKEELPRMFTKFYRGKEARSTDTEGMGIGLYMTHDIVTRHHGKIWVESEGPGKGSTFSISLPVAE